MSAVERCRQCGALSIGAAKWRLGRCHGCAGLCGYCGEPSPLGETHEECLELQEENEQLALETAQAGDYEDRRIARADYENDLAKDERGSR